MNNRRVLIGMSGGIDSTAACLMLKDQGYEVVGVTMRVFDLSSGLNEQGTPRAQIQHGTKEVAVQQHGEHQSGRHAAENAAARNCRQ